MAVNHLAYEKKLKVLLAAYAQAQKTIAAQIKVALQEGKLDRASERLRQAAAVQAVLRELGLSTDSFAEEIVQDAYYQSGRAITSKLPALETSVTAASFNGIARESVDALVTSMVEGLRASRVTVGRQVNDIFAKAARQQVLQGLLGAEGSGRKVSANIRKDLLRAGRTAFIDKAGRNWTLKNYSEMAARTVTREAVTQGAVDRMVTQGVMYCQVSRHASSCPICAPHEGKIMRLDGGQDKTTTSGLVLPPFHPNCKHSVTPYIPGLSNA